MKKKFSIKRLREVKLAEQGIQRGQRPNSWQLAKHENFLLYKKTGGSEVG